MYTTKNPKEPPRETTIILSYI